MDKASFLDDHMLRRIGALAFIYSGVCVAEGIGLYLEKAWGEYLTLVITASFLPWEIFEIIHRITWVRVSLLVVNLAVFIYLFKLVAGRRRRPVIQSPKLDFAFSSPISHSSIFDLALPDSHPEPHW